MKTFASALLLANAASALLVKDASHPLNDRPSEEACNQIVSLVDQNFPGWTNATWWSYIQAKLPAEAGPITQEEYCSSYHGCKALIDCDAAEDLKQCFDNHQAKAPCQVQTAANNDAQVNADSSCGTTSEDQGLCDSSSSCGTTEDCDELAQINADSSCGTISEENGWCTDSDTTSCNTADESQGLCTNDLAQIAEDGSGDPTGGNPTDGAGGDGQNDDEGNNVPHPDACEAIKELLATGVDNWDEFYAEIPEEYRPVTEDEVVGAAIRCKVWNDAWVYPPSDD